MVRTINEINQKIKEGKAVVVTAEEILDVVKKRGMKRALKEVDVVTTGTFGPMCSCINFGHSKPRLKVGRGVCRLCLSACPYGAVEVLLEGA